MDREKAQLVAQISALMQAHNWEVAEARLNEVLKRYPSDAGFLEFMGVAKLNQKKPKDAARFFKKVVKKAPKRAVAYLNLAQAEGMMGALTPALANLRKALQLEANLPDAWILQGNIYATKEQDEKAIGCYEKAVQLRPDSAIFAVKLLSLLEQQNKLDALAAQVSILEKTAPDHPVVKHFKGTLSFRRKDFPAAKAILESFDFRQKSMAQFRELELMRTRYLGVICDELHQESEALLYFRQAKEINRGLHQNPAPPAYFWKMCEMRQDYFKGFKPESWQTRAAHKDEPVFIIGFPRSGTTLLDTFLRGHKDLSILEEKPMVSNMRTVLGTSEQQDILALDRASDTTLSAARTAYFDEVRQHRPKGLVVDKLPMNLVFAGEILRVFPRAKFIFAMRDPADAVFSCFMQSFKLNPPMAALDTLKDAAKTYALALQTWTNTVQALAPAHMTSRYEDLITDPESTLRPIVSFLGVPWDDAMLDHQTTARTRSKINTPSRAQVVEPLYQSSVARWQRYAPLMPEALEILTPWRKEFGYSD